MDSIALSQFKHVYCVVTVNTCVHECGCCGVTFLFVLHALVCTSGCGSENQSVYACAWACVRVYTDGVCMHKKRVKSDGRFQLSTGAQPQNESVELVEDFNEVSPTFLLAILRPDGKITGDYIWQLPQTVLIGAREIWFCF